ncbi:MAG: tetratricopeptide repeat protein [Planctomycetota bacterium]|jgi:tetratricopeptide (TPR) repeat protein
MAKTILTFVLVVFLHSLVGCYEVDSGQSQLLSPKLKATPKEALLTGAGEADVIEQVALNRQAYRNSLESLIAHYRITGNNMMLKWAENELNQFGKIPKYNYIIEAGTARPDLKASTSITEANYIYADAVRLEKKAKRLLLISDENLLRVALGRYNELIKKYPSSDKIDNAAYRAAGIYEHFKDYTIALLYYQRAYQWEPRTTQPARFRAARILDQHMSRKAEALELYKEAIKQENLSEDNKEYAKRRIASITKRNKEIEGAK